MNGLRLVWGTQISQIMANTNLSTVITNLTLNSFRKAEELVYLQHKPGALAISALEQELED